MKASRFSRVALSSIVMIAVVAGSHAASETIFTVTGGPPVVTVTGVAINPVGVTCGAEIDCARVTWTATVPRGTTVSGFDIDLKTTRKDGTFENSKKSVAGSARQADMNAVFHTGADNIASCVVKVTANYTSVASASKSVNF